MIREIRENDLSGLLELYLCLHEQEVPEEDERLRTAWRQMLFDFNHHVVVAERDGKLVSSCVCVVVPNLTRGVRPYALIENVVTHEAYRGKGLATACLNFAQDLARGADCYKMMLLTGAKRDATLDFYRRAGYNSQDKTGFIQWL